MKVFKLIYKTVSQYVMVGENVGNLSIFRHILGITDEEFRKFANTDDFINYDIVLTIYRKDEEDNEESILGNIKLSMSGLVGYLARGYSNKGNIKEIEIIDEKERNIKFPYRLVEEADNAIITTVFRLETQSKRIA